MSSLEEFAIRLERLVDVDNLGARQKLHDETRGYNGRYTEFHQGTSVGSEDNSHPVEGVSRTTGHDTVKGDLTAHKKDEQGDDGPHDLLLEGDLQHSTPDERQD